MARKRPFTLIELFLTLSIIAFVGSLFVVQAGPLLKKYQAKHALSRFEREIHLCQHLSEVASATIFLTVEGTQKGVVCIRKTEDPLSIPGGVNRKTFIPYLQMEKPKKREVVFFPTGVVMLDGTLIEEKNLFSSLLCGEK